MKRIAFNSLLAFALLATKFPSRDQLWDYARTTLELFPENKIPFAEMKNTDALIGNAANDNSRYCLAKSGEVYLVYLPNGGTTELDLTGASGSFTVKWFNPRTGGALADGSVESVTGGGAVELGNPPAAATNDWVALVRR